MRNRGLSLTDVIVGAICLIAIGMFALAFIFTGHQAGGRLKCPSNLRMIGQAILLYQHDFKAFPAAASDVNAPVVVFSGNGAGEIAPAPNDVTAALRLVILHVDVDPDILICPSTSATAIPRNTLASQTNLLGVDQLTYSFINPYRGPRTPATLDLMEAGAEFALAADLAPSPEASMSVTLRSSRDALQQANSPNHDGEGQNVLYGDGHVEFAQNPFVGADRDHIYTFGPSGNDNPDSPGEGVHGFITSMKDSILLPTWTDGPTRIQALGYDRTLRNRGIYAALPWLAVLVAAIAGGLLMWRFRRAR